MKTFFHVSNTVNPARIAFEKFTACTVQVIHRSVIDYCSYIVKPRLQIPPQTNPITLNLPT